MKLLTKITDYRHESKLDRWLFVVAANLARDRARQRQREVFRQAADDEQGDWLDTFTAEVDDPAEQLELQEQHDQLQKALGQLEPLDRELILLRHYGELSFRELAKLYDIPLSTALSKVHRGLQKLRRILPTDGQGI